MHQIPQTLKYRAQRANLCLYHDPCTDGFMANYLFHRYNRFSPAVKSIPVDHRTKGTSEHQEYVLREAADKRVVLYDFSYKRPFLLELEKVAEELTVFDHHVSALGEVGDLSFCHFDMEHSGAMLAYQSLWPATQMVDVLLSLTKSIEKQDLYGPHNIDPHARAINAWVNSHKRTLDDYDHLVQTYNRSSSVKGYAILRDQERHVEACLRQKERWFIGGTKWGYAVNTNHLPSEVAGMLATGAESGRNHFEKPAWGGTYWIKDGQMTWSLRSTEERNTDVSLLAGYFPGGGGHARSAGFTVPLGRVDFMRRVVK